MRVKYLLASTALTSAAVASGSAVAQPVTYNWTGWYVGVNLGGSSTRIEQNVNVPTFFSFPSNDRDSGFTGGIGGGYNVQFLPGWVTGIEVDMSYLRGEHSSALTRINFDGRGGATGEDLVGTQNSKLSWLSTIRGRLGPTLGRTFFYGTGGLAIGKVSSSVTATVTQTGGGGDRTEFAGSTSSIRTGWTAGGGVEHAFTDRLTFKVEYLHFDLGEINYNVIGTVVTTTPNGVVPLMWPSSARFTGDIVRFGLSAKLGGP